jgi:hypothetical protein
MKHQLKRIDALLASLNGLGILAYLVCASFSWRIPEEDAAGLSTGMAGSALVWASSALPLLLLAVIANVIAFTSLLKRGLVSQFERRLFFFIGLAWVVAISVDFSRH